MPRLHRAAVRRGLLWVAILAALWSGLIVMTGGFVLRLADLRMSSRDPGNPLLAAIICGAIAFALAMPNPRVLLDDVLHGWSSASSAALAALRWLPRPGVAAVIAMAGAVLHLSIWMRAQPLWLDEQMIAINIRDRSVMDLLGALWLDQSAPFGWLAAERVALLVLGASEPALRLVPLICSIAALAAAGWVGRRWMTMEAAAAFALLFALAPFTVYYAAELKHYSADILFALALPAIAVWAFEGDGPRARLRRSALWWAAAVVAQWCSNGGLLVAPACALVLAIFLLRKDGWRSAASFAAVGVVWLAAFGLNYALVLRHAVNSDFLRGYWAATMPPASAGIGERVAWMVSRLPTIARDPGASGLPALFWAAFLIGLACAPRPIWRWILAAIPISAGVLAVIGLVPFYQRLALWVLPAFYLGIAFSLDRGSRWIRESRRGATPVPVAVALVICAGSVAACADIAARGWDYAVYEHPADSNHQLDDRSGVEWLMLQRRPGDVVLTTRLGLPAIWWYGGVPLSAGETGGSMPDGTPIVEVSYRPRGGCDMVGTNLAGYRRALVYFGFRFDDVPDDFDELLLDDLRQIGHVVDLRRFAGVSAAAVVQLTGGTRASASASNGESGIAPAAASNGCLSAGRASRW